MTKRSLAVKPLTLEAGQASAPRNGWCWPRYLLGSLALTDVDSGRVVIWGLCLRSPTGCLDWSRIWSRFSLETGVNMQLRYGRHQRDADPICLRQYRSLGLL